MKSLSFYRLSVFSSLLFTVLAFVLIFAPVLMLSAWGVELTDSVGLVTRRIGALYAGIALMYFFARNAQYSATRTALIVGTITACLILATLGVFEFIAGHASSGILISVLIEVVLILAFLYVGARKE
ncbi:MAG TPA: hypothetical protein VK952_07850 [Methylotenera sp.]|nr:hypothetical protein [Methylotenera sp.]